MGLLQGEEVTQPCEPITALVVLPRTQGLRLLRGILVRFGHCTSSTRSLRKPVTVRTTLGHCESAIKLAGPLKLFGMLSYYKHYSTVPCPKQAWGTGLMPQELETALRSR